jgi:hypothetical protein
MSTKYRIKWLTAMTAGATWLQCRNIGPGLAGGFGGWSILDALQVTARAGGQELVLDVSVDLESIGAAQEFLHRRRTLVRRSRPIRPQVSRQLPNQLVLDDN